MCGIVGIVSDKNVVPRLLEGLLHLEYRGYDSAGIAIIDEHQRLLRYRREGKIHDLQESIANKALTANIGIAHTRWATHGKPNIKNAHPHIAGDCIAVVHNGIIENYTQLRTELLANGCKLESETDSELIAHLVYETFKANNNFLNAVQLTLPKLQGSFALAFLNQREPQHLLVARRGNPLVLGLGENENFVASDQLALLNWTQQFIFLEEDDVADIYQDQYVIYDSEHNKVTRKIHCIENDPEQARKEPFPHFMLKEIFSQPDVLQVTLQRHTSRDKVILDINDLFIEKILPHINTIHIVACGTSFHAGLIAKFWFEALANIPCQVEIASEYRYQKIIVPANTLFIAISQSGETADTLGALRLAKDSGYLATLAICNVAESSLVREASFALMTSAGIEIGVASTKTFTCQLLVLFLLALVVAHQHGLTLEQEKELLNALRDVINDIQAILNQAASIEKLAPHFANATNALFLARDIQFPVALEGALKLKELAYIHAEAFPAGELKHGPLALVDKNMPIIVLAPNNKILDKLKSNIEEVLARGGKLFIFSDAIFTTSVANEVLSLPPTHPLLSPILYVIPMQLFAYYVAHIKGNNIDQPRNLAKSVTVE